MSSTLSVRVKRISYEAQDVLSYELVPVPPATELPPFTAGAHIDVHLPDGPTRCYSLWNNPAERHRYAIAVHLTPQSRGGSRAMHQRIRPGDVLTISAPRNHFPADESAAPQVFVAGGIGITPLMSMVARAIALGQNWQLHYCARTRAHAAFVAELLALAPGAAERIHFNFDQEPGGAMLDLPALMGALPSDAHVYCCGPQPMLEAFEKANALRPPAQVHREYFGATESAANDGGYRVELVRSKRTLQVLPGKTLLESLIAIHAEPPYSCQQGICGTCEVKVLGGTPDHRDMVLSDAEKAANNRMMVCCSGARTDTLQLDL